MTHITVELLEKHNACSEQVELFQRIFGSEAELTQENWDKAIAEGLNVFWLENVLPDEKKEEYLKIEQPAWKEYQKIRDSAYKEYQKIEQSAYEEYLKKQSAYEEYLKIEQPALEEYQKTRQTALFEILKPL